MNGNKVSQEFKPGIGEYHLKRGGSGGEIQMKHSIPYRKGLKGVTGCLLEGDCFDLCAWEVGMG